MREHAQLLKEISDHLDKSDAFVDPKALATEFAARYDTPSMDRIEAHIIDQLRMRGRWAKS